MKVSLKYEKDGHIEKIQIDTLIYRLKEVKGDIKIRVEIIREIMHNLIDAGARVINIDIEPVGIKNNEKIKKLNVIIEGYGENLEPFQDVEAMVNCLLKIDQSDKKK